MFTPALVLTFVGVIFGTTTLLVRDTVGDWFTRGLAAASFIIILPFRIRDAVIVIAVGLLGLALFQGGNAG